MAIPEKKSEEVEITPLKDWEIHCPPYHEHLILKKGEKVKVKAMFIEGLKIEKVIGG